MNCSNYWGKPDGSIDFCEVNYKENMYIAEYWNTISASVYFVIGLLWMFTKYKKISFSFMFLSLGTALWHGTLRYGGQWADEVGMLVLTFNLIKQIHPSVNIQWLFLLIGIYFSFQDIFFIFGGLFLVLQTYIWLCARLMKVGNEWNWTIYNCLLGFIGGTILNNKNNKFCSDEINSIIRKEVDKLYNYAELSNLTKADELHFTSEATRIAGKLYYEAYENLVNKFK